jgi:hypothetical protein
MHMRAMLDARRNHEHVSNIPTYVIKDGLAVSVLAFSTAICIFCLQCVRVIWPGGERPSAISKIVENEWSMLVGTMHRPLPFFINLVMWLVYCLYLVRIAV